MKTHHLKTWPTHFDAIFHGKKRFEIRKDDREFKVGDILILEEFNPTVVKYTGQQLSATVVYLHRGMGMQPKYVTMGIEIISFDKKEATP